METSTPNLDQAKKFDMNNYDKIVFSYHGLPMSHVNKIYNDTLCSDNDCELGITKENKFCYKATTYETTKLLAEKLNINPDNYIVSYQSRLTKNWLEPFSDEVINELGKSGNEKVLVFSPAFTADCLETIIEIGDEYVNIRSNKSNLTLSTNEHNFLTQMLIEFLDSKVQINHEKLESIIQQSSEHFPEQIYKILGDAGPKREKNLISYEFWKKLFEPISAISVIVFALAISFRYFGFNKNLERLLFGVLTAYGFNLFLKVFGNIAIINGFSPGLAIVFPSLFLLAIGLIMLRDQ